MADEQNGFEWRNRVYPWSVSDIGKDLMLIDRIAQIPASDFIELVADADQNERSPVLFALIATSLRAGHPEWSIERIYRIVMDISLTKDITFLTSGEEDDESRPPPVEAATPPQSEAGRSPSNGSSPPSTPQEPSTSPTSSAIPL